jgi:hypothetical protein
VTCLKAGAAAEVRERLPFLLGHVVAVGDPRVGDGLPPGPAADRMLVRAADAVPDVVVVADGVRGLLPAAVRPGGAWDGRSAMVRRQPTRSRRG